MNRIMRRNTIDHSVPKQGPVKEQRMDLGLAILCERARPGATFSYEDIAGFAGCSGQNIKLIERKAFKKLRYRLNAIQKEAES